MPLSIFCLPAYRNDEDHGGHDVHKPPGGFWKKISAEDWIEEGHALCAAIVLKFTPDKINNSGMLLTRSFTEKRK